MGMLFDGTKARQHRSNEDRAALYRDWRRTFGPHLYVNDIDHVEWRMVERRVEPVAVLELTRVDGSVPVPSAVRV
jgi:hypothetical protein